MQQRQTVKSFVFPMREAPWLWLLRHSLCPPPLRTKPGCPPKILIRYRFYRLMKNLWLIRDLGLLTTTGRKEESREYLPKTIAFRKMKTHSLISHTFNNIAMTVVKLRPSSILPWILPVNRSFRRQNEMDYFDFVVQRFFSPRSRF